MPRARKTPAPSATDRAPDRGLFPDESPNSGGLTSPGSPNPPAPKPRGKAGRAAKVELPLADLRAKAMEVHDRLCREYGCPVPFFHDHDPLTELVSALLSHRTRDEVARPAFKRLKQRFGSWEGVRDAPTAEVQEVIADCTWPEAKAPRVQQVLRDITRLRGELSLEFLRDMPVDEARAWLEAIPGVGPKTSAAVLLFSDLRKPAMPVDSHHHRVAERLGLIPPRTSLDKAHDLLARLLPEGWSAQQVFDHHEVLMFHGRKCCFWANPQCGRCVVLDLCPTGQARLGPGTTREGTGG